MRESASAAFKEKQGSLSDWRIVNIGVGSKRWNQRQ